METVPVSVWTPLFPELQNVIVKEHLDPYTCRALAMTCRAYYQERANRFPVMPWTLPTAFNRTDADDMCHFAQQAHVDYLTDWFRRNVEGEVPPEQCHRSVFMSGYTTGLVSRGTDFAWQLLERLMDLTTRGAAKRILVWVPEPGLSLTVPSIYVFLIAAFVAGQNSEFLKRLIDSKLPRQLGRAVRFDDADRAGTLAFLCARTYFRNARHCPPQIDVVTAVGAWLWAHYGEVDKRLSIAMVFADALVPLALARGQCVLVGTLYHPALKDDSVLKYLHQAASGTWFQRHDDGRRTASPMSFLWLAVCRAYFCAENDGLTEEMLCVLAGMAFLAGLEGLAIDTRCRETLYHFARKQTERAPLHPLLYRMWPFLQRLIGESTRLPPLPFAERFGNRANEPVPNGNTA